LRSQVWGTERRRTVRQSSPAKLENLRQFGSECAAGRLFPVAAAAFLAVGFDNAGSTGIGRYNRLRSTALFALRGLRRIGSQQTVFQRRTIETADDGSHFVGGRSFDKREALRFLRFVIADHFDGVGDQIFGGEPLLDVIGCDPRREVAKKDGKAHSVDSVTPWLDFRHWGDSDLPHR